MTSMPPFVAPRHPLTDPDGRILAVFCWDAELIKLKASVFAIAGIENAMERDVAQYSIQVMCCRGPLLFLES